MALALSLIWHCHCCGSSYHCGMDFIPGPGNFCMPLARLNKIYKYQISIRISVTQGSYIPGVIKAY